jgi:hypothetical protein
MGFADPWPSHPITVAVSGVFGVACVFIVILLLLGPVACDVMSCSRWKGEYGSDNICEIESFEIHHCMNAMMDAG